MCFFILIASTGVQAASTRVIDGDTVDWNGKRWRLAAIDAPERGEPGYEAAKQRLSKLLAEKPTSEAPTCRPNGDRAQQRVVGSCYAKDGNDVALTLVREGLAAVCHQRREARLYAQAEREAQRAKRGIWVNARYVRKPYCPPPR